MTWRPLSDWVIQGRRPLAEHRVPIGPSTSSREAIASAAVLAWGPEFCIQHPAALNVAGLGFAMMDRLILHRWTRDAVDMVHATDLHSLPDEPPRLLQRAFLIETRHPEQGHPLFGTTVCLGGYRLSDDDATWWLVGFQWPDGIVVARWTPTWSGEDLREGVPYDSASPLIADIDGHREWGVEAARFAVVAGLLLDASGSPVAAEAPRQSNAARRREEKAGPRAGESWAIRRVALAGEGSSSRGGSSGAASVDTVEGRLPVEADVRGHLKRQRHGPGGELRRWIWVEGYQARRWVAAKPLRIDVRAN